MPDLQVIPNEPNHPNRKPIGFSMTRLTKQPLTKKVRKVQKVRPWRTSRTALTASWVVARRADEGPPGRGPADPEGGRVKPEEVRREIGRLQDERLRLAPEVRGGGRAARRGHQAPRRGRA